jgi:transposase
MPAFDRRVDPEVREVRRLEVITGALGRRRWSAEAKARIVAESLAPGVVISDVARRHDLRPQQLLTWRHQARQGRLALPAAELSFVPVVGASDAPPAAPSAVSAGMIEVALGGAVVRSRPRPSWPDRTSPCERSSKSCNGPGSAGAPRRRPTPISCSWPSRTSSRRAPRARPRRRRATGSSGRRVPDSVGAIVAHWPSTCRGTRS